ncbi:MAG: YbhB/YbcL family Raf kinase inhibitor-like protein [Desulfuromonadales bacterium]|nr:YbhB/YbcL family Raf kinase inhibitor-like protein [Desulfuromonadales bacterium]
MGLELHSPVIRNQTIPQHYTCDGDNVSPPLAWGNVPEGTRSLALVADDPDAPGGVFTHWVLYNLPPEIRELPEDVRRDEILPSGAMQGINDFDRIGYGGPCPPGGTHRYFFTLYALDRRLELEPGATKEQLRQAMRGHIVAEAQIVGKYSRH